jgi:hypothetical protein
LARTKPLFVCAVPFLFSFFTVHALCADDLRVREAAFFFAPEYNRTFDFCSDVSASAAFELTRRITLRGGLALGNTGNEFDLKTFAGGQAALLPNFPLYAELYYNLNAIPGYEYYVHSVLPLVSIKGKMAGISAGTNLRFSVFFNDPAAFENTLSVYAYIYFYNTPGLRIGISAANFDDFFIGNMGSYYLTLNGLIRFSETLSLDAQIKLMQNGSSGLASNFYGVAFRVGAIIKW